MTLAPSFPLSSFATLGERFMALAAKRGWQETDVVQKGELRASWRRFSPT